MVASLSLSVYLVIGLFFARNEFNKILTMFDEELDENDPDEKDLLDKRNQLYDQMHNVHKLIGYKGLWMVVHLFLMIFWLPIIIYTNIRA